MTVFLIVIAGLCFQAVGYYVLEGTRHEMGRAFGLQY